MTTIKPNWAVTDVKASPNYSQGRPAGDPTVIVCHHWGADGQTHQGVVDYLCRSGGNSSAHYVASAGRVTQLVSDRDRAWHAGPAGNPRGIGIECRPEMSEADVETVATLIAAIRSEHGNLPVRGHRDYMSTACPGRWYAQLSRLSARADEILAARTTGTKTTATTTTHSATTATVKPAAHTTTAALAVDGWWGQATTRRLQQVLGTTVDGIVSSQDTGRRSILKACTSGWQWTVNPEGSQLITAMQKRMGISADGIVGPQFVNALEKRYGFQPDGHLDGPSNTVRELQRRLNKGTI